MRNFCLSLLLLLCVGCNTDTKPREGDIIFNTGTKNQSALLERATQSTITQCGIIIKKDDGFYVLHVDKSVTMIPLHSFIKQGARSEYTIMRATDKEVKIDYNKYMLAEYDFLLSLDNDRYYNSELVYLIYKNDLGIELCQPRAIKDYKIEGMESMLSERRIKLNQLVVSPADLFNSKKLRTIQTHKDRIKMKREKSKTK